MPRNLRRIHLGVWKRDRCAHSDPETGDTGNPPEGCGCHCSLERKSRDPSSRRSCRFFAEEAIDCLHIDIWTAGTPNFTFGPDFRAALARATAIPLDIHLMIANPDAHIPAFAEFPTATITFHPKILPPGSNAAVDQGPRRAGRHRHRPRRVVVVGRTSAARLRCALPHDGQPRPGRPEAVAWGPPEASRLLRPPPSPGSGG